MDTSNYYTKWYDRCNKCGRDNSQHNNYCDQCGNRLFYEVLRKSCPKCGQYYFPSKDKYCTYCGICFVDYEKEMEQKRIREMQEEIQAKAIREAEEAARKASGATLIFKVVGRDKLFSDGDGYVYSYNISGNGRSHWVELELKGSISIQTLEGVDPGIYEVSLGVKDGSHSYIPDHGTSCSICVRSREVWTLESKRAPTLGRVKIKTYKC